jgi:hypothetical protein
MRKLFYGTCRPPYLVAIDYITKKKGDICKKTVENEFILV